MQESFIFTISAAENKSILSRVLMLFTRRNIAFENLTASRPDDGAHYSFRIEANTTRHWAEQITKELRKIIGVGHAAFLRQEELVQKQVALYRINRRQLPEPVLQHILLAHQARLLTSDQDSFVLEKTGNTGSAYALLEALQPYGVQEFSNQGSLGLTAKTKQALTA
ncbi:hypothetical protein [Pontibacter liquoris]|uniref:hypothetical protein n=1 Tax=Pontibacter liquoris TaxID=2905677 RepID=UPI001FA7D7C3|nr:hypothetical protein [Pontibacter liquoris]